VFVTDQQPPLPDPAAALAYFQQKAIFTMNPDELRRRIMEGADLHVIDVREREDYDRGHIPGAVNLSQDRWTTNSGLAKGKVNVFYGDSATSLSAAKAAAYFAKRKFPVMELLGGFDAWTARAFEIER
jgi:rhodanese-related sulfurtransferase